MAKLSLVKGTTSKIVHIFIPDSSSTTGAGLTGLVFNSASLAAYYIRPGDASATAITLATATVGTWATGGFKEVSSANMPGVYEFDIPDACLASGANQCVIMLKGATNMAPTTLEIELTAVNNQSATAFITGVNSLAPPTGWNLLTITGTPTIGGTGTFTITGAVATQAGTLPITTSTMDANVTKLLGTAWLTPGTAGTPDVNVKLWNALATVALPLVPTVAGRTLDVSAGGEAGLDWANIGSPTTVVNLSGTTIVTVSGSIGGNVSGSVLGTVVGSVGSIAAGGIAAASFAASAINSGAIASGAIHATAIATDAIRNDAIQNDAITASKIADSAIDRATFAVDTGLRTIRSNTAAAGAAGTITLDASASSVDDFYANTYIFITGGTGAGQARFISSYVGSTQVASVNGNWKTTPDNTSTFAIIPFGAIPGASAPTAAQVATAVWQDAAAGDFTTAGSIGKSLFTSGAVPGAAGGLLIAGSNAATTFATLTSTGAFTVNGTSNVAQTGDSFARIGANGASLSAIQLPSNGLANVTAWTVNLTGSLSGSVGSVTGNIGGTLSSTERNAIADAHLNRDMSAVTVTNSRSPINALRFLRNKWSLSGTTLTVTAEDDTTSVWTSVVTTNAAADPITGNDPS